MNGAGWLFVFFALGYIAFELYGLHASRHLMQPDHIHGQFVLADQAQRRCGEADAALDAKFARNLASVRRSAVRDWTRAEPPLSAEDATAAVAAQDTERRAEVDALVAANGCSDKQIWNWMLLYKQRAQMNLP